MAKAKTDGWADWQKVGVQIFITVVLAGFCSWIAMRTELEVVKTKLGHLEDDHKQDNERFAQVLDQMDTQNTRLINVLEATLTAAKATDENMAQLAQAQMNNAETPEEREAWQRIASELEHKWVALEERTDGVMLMMGDGSVHFATENIDLDFLNHLNSSDDEGVGTF